MNATTILRRALDHVLNTDPGLSEGTVFAYYILRRALRAVKNDDQVHDDQVHDDKQEEVMQ